MEELQITNLEAIKTTSDSITIEWEVVTNIPAEKISYEAVLFGETDGKYEVSDPLQETNSYTFNNLMANTEYSVFVRVYEEPANHLIIEYPAEGKTVKTTAILPKKPKENPKQLSVTNVSDKAFTIVWEKSEDKGIRYQAFLKEAGEPDEAWRQLTNKMNVGSTRARGLKPDTQYVFYVNLLNADDSIFRHDEGEARTHETVQKPTHYTPLKVKNATGYHLKFVWDEIRNQEVRYNAFIKESSSKGWTQIAENLTDITAITAGDLKPDTLYDFYYEIINKAGKVIRHEECSARTSDKVLKVSNITSDGFTLEWEPLTEDKAKHQATMYGVQWEGEEPGSGKARNETGISSYTVTGLKPGNSYTARVLVFDQDFTYEIAEPIRIPFPEKEETPDKNVPILNSNNLQTSYIRGDSFRIYWEYAKDASGKDWANRHLVFLKEEDAPDTAWGIIAEVEGRRGEQTGVVSAKNLKPGTWYVFYIEATNEAGETLQYNQGCAQTLAVIDNETPTVNDRTLTITDITSDGFTVKWEKAKDNVTPSEKIFYEAILIEDEEKDTSKWRCFAQGRDMDSARATGLKPATKYKVWVHAKDEARRTLSYPSAGTGHVLVKTLDNIVSETPFANDKALRVTRVTSFSFTIEWEKARSKDTGENAIRYLIYLKKKGSKTYQNPDQIYGVGAYTFFFSRGGASYTCFVRALDAKGNSFDYDEVDVHLPSADKKHSSSPNSIVLSKQEEVYSNGVYSGLSFNYKTTALFEELGNQFKRDCFEVSFEFFILPNNIEGTRSWGLGGQNNALVSLGSNPSGLIITLTNDYKVCVMADTQQYRMAYPCYTPIQFKKEVWQSFKLLYIDGDLIINDDILLPIGKFNNFNKVITSVNFYSGTCFIGYIRNLVVKSL